MKVEHIVWEDRNWTDKNIHGILELDIHWHGGGTYMHNGRGKFVNSFVAIDGDTNVGVSGVSLRRIGTIVP